MGQSVPIGGSGSQRQRPGWIDARARRYGALAFVKQNVDLKAGSVPPSCYLPGRELRVSKDGPAVAEGPDGARKEGEDEQEEGLSQAACRQARAATRLGGWSTGQPLRYQGPQEAKQIHYWRSS